jgi:hypothetical protein
VESERLDTGLDREGPRIRAWLDALDRDATSGSLASTARHALQRALETRPAPSWPEDLVARPAPTSAGAWHLAALDTADREPLPAPSAAARRAYHARWLGHLLDPDDPRAAPRVSVVIPCFGEGELLLRAVRSALAQTWPRIEVVVVDDGSPSDGAAKALASLIPNPERPVHRARQENRGVACARNRGVQMARGDLVHFLDADDEMAPDAVARKMEALRCVPDAEIVCSRYDSAGHSGWRGVDSHTGPDFGDPHCPTHDLLRSALRRYPFHTSSVLMPRWILLGPGRFDERLRRGSDTRLWMALGMRDTKVAALRAPLGTRHFHPESLTAGEEDRSLVRPAVLLLSLADLLAEPAHWPVLGVLAGRMSRITRWQPLDEDPDPAVEAARRALVAEVESLGRDGLREGMSARLPLLVVQQRLVTRTAVRATEGRLRTPLAAALEAALARSPHPTPADAERWLSAPEAADKVSRPAVDALLDWMDRQASLGPLPGWLGRPMFPRDAGRRATEIRPTHPASNRLRLWAEGRAGAPRLLLHRLRQRARGRRS